MSNDEFDDCGDLSPFDYNQYHQDAEYKKLLTARKARDLTHSTIHQQKLGVVKAVLGLVKTATSLTPLSTEITLSNDPNDSTTRLCQALIDNPNDQSLLISLGYKLTITTVLTVTTIVISWETP